MILLILFSCKKRPPQPATDEGIIVYKISYLEDRVGGYSAGVLPQTMRATFKDNKIKNTIEGAMGFFSLTNIADLDEMTNTTYLKFIDKKYIYNGKKKESPCCFGKLEGMVITLTDGTKEIIGFQCKEATITFPGTERESFTVYYTTEINFDKPNATSPFKDIPGILLEFRTNLGNSEITMTAEDYTAMHIPEKEFLIPRNYREIRKNEIENILNTLLE